MANILNTTETTSKSAVLANDHQKREACLAPAVGRQMLVSIRHLQEARLA